MRLPGVLASLLADVSELARLERASGLGESVDLAETSGGGRRQGPGELWVRKPGPPKCGLQVKLVQTPAGPGSATTPGVAPVSAAPL